MTGTEFDYIREAHFNKHLAGNGDFTKRCQSLLESTLGCPKALLTHSATSALELAALLANIGAGDEVIMPSYTFVSTASAFALRGAVPVFVDIRADTLNLDEAQLEAAITPRTRAIVPVHYAGVACAMDEIMAIARRHRLLVIEDAAQAVGSSYRGRALGTIGNIGVISFHETKNVISGEGGAILINDERLIDRAEILWEKGTDRARYFRGEVDKYTWIDLGSSFLPSELVAAFLWAQLQRAEELTRDRLSLWWTYHAAFTALEASGRARRPVVPPDCAHNAHIYYLLLPDLEGRTAFMGALKARGINTTFHYIPLHDSPAGRRFGRAVGELPVTCAVSDRLVRLPLWIGMKHCQQTVISEVLTYFDAHARKRIA
jgi:dTDP-4-amino-4,6-dideoxygalactose transaminase